MHPLNLVSDHAIAEFDNTRQDALGFSHYADVISRIVQGTRGPFTIGIFGEWGMGKTSLMKMVEQNIKATPTKGHYVIPVWFNAWMFERAEYPVVPLIKSIVEALKPYNSIIEKTDETAANLVQTLQALAEAFKLKGKLNFPAEGIGIELEADPGRFLHGFRQRTNKRKFGTAENDPYEDIFKALRAISDGAVPKYITIVVLIDDLDRCFPENAVRLLESIKLVLSQPGFIYILGASRVVIEEYLQSKYQKQYGITHYDGKAYLDKMIQLSFDIPPHAARVNDFTEQIIEGLRGVSMRKELGAITPVIGRVCQYNPRTIIRFINRLITDSAIYKQTNPISNQKLPIGIFAITRSIQHSWRDFYGLLIGDDSQEDRAYCKILASWNDRDISWWKDYKPEINEHVEYATSVIGQASVVNPEVLKQLATNLSDDRILMSLMVSENGHDWLSKHSLREMSISFIATQPPIEDGVKEFDAIRSYDSTIAITPPNTMGSLYLENELYRDALRVVIDARKASTSLLQRRLNIGYGRAARVIDLLEEQGIISPSEGNRPREVLVDSVEEALDLTRLAEDKASDLPNRPSK